MNDRAPMKPAEGLKRPSALPSPPSPPQSRDRSPSGSSRVSQLHPQGQESAGVDSPQRMSDAAETTRVLSISLPLSISDQFRDRARHQGTQVDVLLDAIERHVDQLNDLVMASRQHAPRKSGGLFDRVPSRLTRGGPFVSISLRMKSINVETIDRLAQQSGADSRSHLCAVALEAYLANS